MTPDPPDRGRPLRILVVGPTGYAPLERPLRWLVEDGYEIGLVADEPSATTPGTAYRFFRLGGGTASRLLAGLVGRRNADTARIPLTAVALRRAAAAFRPDFVHVHLLNWRAAAGVVAGLSPLVVSVWGAVNPRDVPLDPADPRFRLHRGVLRRCTAAIVDSEAGAVACRQLAGASLRAKVIPLGVDTRSFRPAEPAASLARRRTLDIAPEDFVFLSPRGCSEIYRHDRILEAFARARERIGRPSFLVFVGLPRGTPAEVRRIEASVRERAGRLRVAEHVRWLPAQPYAAMPDLYALCDAVVSYPTTDGFASTLVEAAACQRPIVSARLPAYRGTFMDDFAKLVEGDDLEALADAMLAVADPARAPSRERLAEARRRVARDHAEEISRRRLAELYREIARA